MDAEAASFDAIVNLHALPAQAALTPEPRRPPRVPNKMVPMEPFPIPPNLREAAQEDGWQWWLDTLSRTVADLTERWALQVGAPFEPGGSCAWVAPVTDAAGAELVLKLGLPHPEADHEADGLREWAGDGTVQLHAFEELETTTALLLERCTPGTPLRTRPPAEQDEVIVGLLRRLWRVPAPGHRFRPLQSMCDMWAREFEEDVAPGRGGVDPGLAREGMALFRSLPATANRHVLLATDLHAANVLAAKRKPWLAIDPKPYVGDPAYDVLQHMFNCDDRLLTDPRGFAYRMADLASLERDRVALWVFARSVQWMPRRPYLGTVARRVSPG